MKLPSPPSLDSESKVNALWGAGIALLSLGAGIALGAGIGLALAGLLLLITATLFAKGTT